MEYSARGVLSLLYGGVDLTLAGNGGAECCQFLSGTRKLTETALLSVVSLAYIGWGLAHIRLPQQHQQQQQQQQRRYSGGEWYDNRSALLLLLVSLVFGAEITFKLVTRQVIFLLNPCHVITALQIALLVMPPSRLVTTLFRVHIYFLNGAVLALLFPVTNTRLLPFEVEVYWIQHLMMLVVPFHLIRLGGVYSVERLGDLSWAVFSTGVQCLYSFLLLQAISLMTSINLNGMLCPNISDPFYGPWYRVATFLHQSLFITACSKLYCWTCTTIISRYNLSLSPAGGGSCSCFSDTTSCSCCCSMRNGSGYGAKMQSHTAMPLGKFISNCSQMTSSNGNATPFCANCTHLR